MNELSLLTSFLVSHFEQDELVNTITFVKTKLIDNNKENIYQLVNIDYLQCEVLPQAVIARYLITSVQQLNILAKKTDSKLQLDTNLIDNLNETQAVIQRLLNVFKANHFPRNIDLYSKTTLDRYNSDNLNGHQITIELSIPNLGSGALN